jgi:hypothetical protein
MLSLVALVITDVSEQLGALIIRVTRIGELRKFAVTLIMEAISFSETSLFQEPHGVISQKTQFF